MSVKIIASDFDGTLNRDSGISERDSNAIRRWQQAGNLFGLVTGRDIHDAAYIANDPECSVSFDFIICCSGSIVLDKGCNIIYDGSGKIPCLDRLSEHLLKYGPMWLGLCNRDRRYGLPVGQNSKRLPGETAEDGRHFLSKNDFCRLSCFSIIQTAFPTFELAREVTDITEAEFGEWIHICMNNFYLDIVPRDGGKSTGIRALAGLLGADTEDIITVGDNVNDVDMLSDFCGYAVSTGKEAAKAAARYVTEDIAEIISSRI